VINDGVNQYLYDAEGRVCAVQAQPINGMVIYTGYLYNAEGHRVAKGSLTSFSCNLATNGFTAMTESVVGQGGEQLSELALDENGTMTWQHTNVYAAGALFASYDPNGLHFLLNDWLGTRRVQTDYAGNVEQTCQGLPFGDGLTCTNSLTAPSEHHFTGYQYDTESGNDYAEARYYASSMGRFMSPDPSGLAYADQTNPQSLNLYSYALNNPMVNADPSGLDCITVNDDGSTQTTNTGDCPGQDPNSEYYVNCDGCLGGNVQVNNIPSTGNTSITYSDSNGTFAADLDGNIVPILDINGVSLDPSTGDIMPFGGAGAPVSISGYQAGPSPYAPSNAPTNPRATQCKIKVGAGLALDTAGTVAGLIPGAGAALVTTQVSLGLASAAYSAYNGSAAFTIGNATGAQLSAVAAGAEYVGWKTAAKALPWVGTLYNAGALAWDAYHAQSDYQACLAGG
jgi:RHS repeat-associated protein